MRLNWEGQTTAGSPLGVGVGGSRHRFTESRRGALLRAGGLLPGKLRHLEAGAQTRGGQAWSVSSPCLVSVLHCSGSFFSIDLHLGHEGKVVGRPKDGGGQRARSELRLAQTVTSPAGDGTEPVPTASESEGRRGCLLRARRVGQGALENGGGGSLGLS